MVLKLSDVSIEGFRGFNEKQSFPIMDGVNLLFGDNGQGKSSLLQAIEWCFTGELPYFSGSDFTREDAIVNEFTSKRTALVSISADDSDNKIVLSRTRKMGKSSTRGV